MKFRLFILAQLLVVHCTATNYYFSSTSGNDSHSATQASKPTTPWRSINKLNEVASTFVAGDSILFKCGDQFFGTIIPKASGASAKHIVYSSYGTGAKPTINGFIIPASWINKGNGLWEATISSASRVNMLIVNGAPRALGRYPNDNTSDGGFLSIEDYDGSGTVSNKSLSYANNVLTNGELVIRKNRWVIDRDKITANSGKTVKGANSSGYHPTKGFGFFIQNHISTLDKQDEWYHDLQNNKLYVYSLKDPKASNTKVTALENILLIQNKSFITFKNLSFQGGNNAIVKLENAGNVVVSGCDIYYAGKDAINGLTANNFTIEQSDIAQVNNNAVSFDKLSATTTIRSNKIRKTAVWAGMGASGDHTYQAIYACGNGLTVENNLIDEVGYVGIRFEGNNVLIRNNYITNFLTVKDDGAAIYTWKGVNNNWNNVNRKIVGNVILNGKGQAFGAPPKELLLGTGIYIDDNVGDVEITGNTVAHCSYAGLYVHNSFKLQIHDNTFFDNTTQALFGHDNIAPNSPIRNIDFTENVLYSKNSSQHTLSVRTIKDDVKSFGRFNNNYYNNPNEPDFHISVRHLRNGKDVNELTDVAGWRSIFGHDLSSKNSQLLVLPTISVKKILDNKVTNGSFNSHIQNTSYFSSANDCALTWEQNSNHNGGALKVSVRNSTLTNKIFVFIQLKNVRENRRHMVKFSISGKETLKPTEVFLREHSAPYTEISERRRLRISAQRKDHTLYFKTSRAANEGWLVFELNDPQGPVVLDNIEVLEIEADETIPNTNIRFEYNVTPSVSNLNLQRSHVDGKGNFLTGMVPILSFHSKVFMENHFDVLSPQQLQLKISREQPGLVELHCESLGAGAGDQYEMQRSLDGKNFLTIRQIVSVARLESSGNAFTSFNYTDNVNDVKRQLYRVKRTSETGEILYSNVVVSTAEMKEAAHISVYPNPAGNHITISLNKNTTPSKLTILNAAGVVVHSAEVSRETEKHQVDITSLAAGFHTVQLVNTQGTFLSRFIKTLF